ncbi:MAG: VWA domain-containing protein [Ancrocorticia sp.]
MSSGFRANTARVATAALILTTMSSISAVAIAADEKPTTPTMVILDASGSMLENDAPGLRIDAAKKAVHDMVSGLPSDAELGLVVYGNGTGSSEAEAAAGCKDVTTLVPVGPVNSKKFLSTVDGIEASGYTPIGEALRTAAKGLPKEGPRAIVLVSDGEDTCAPPPPCDVAKELAQDGVDLTVHTVGFKVDAAARADLSCIAQATGGSYSDANDAAQLGKALEQKVEWALQSYDVVGKPIKGADSKSAEDMPVLTPGQWVETFPAMADGKTPISRYYRIEPPAGWTPHVTATGTIDANSEGDSAGTATKLSLEAITPDGDVCESDQDFTLWVADSNEPVISSLTPDCEGETLIKITRDDQVHYASDMAVEILVRFEPPSDISGVPEPEEKGLPEAPAIEGDAIPVTGGLSFNSATEIKVDQTYSGTITKGEHVYFKVPMTWGQQLAYRFRQDDVEGMSKNFGMNFFVRLYDPLRRDLGLESETWSAPGGSESPDVRGGTKEVLRATSNHVNLDGFYYLAVRVDGSYKQGEVTQDYSFRIATPGMVEKGPIYQTDGTPLPSDMTTTASAAESATSAATVSAGPAEPTSSLLDNKAFTWGAIIAGIVAILAAGFALGRRSGSGGAR